MNEPIKTKKKTQKSAYYDIAPIKALNAPVNVMFGERGPGKTFSMLSEVVLKDFWEAYKKHELAQTFYIRQMEEDTKSVYMSTVFDTIICDGEKRNRVEEITEGVFNSVYYFQGKFYLEKLDESRKRVDKCSDPIMFVGNVSTSAKHGKGAAYPHVTNIWFEEFMSLDGHYLREEFKLFQNMLSTITRDRQNVKLWLTGNSIDPLCPYFKNLGITKAFMQKEGTIDVYKLGKTDRTIAVERTLPKEKYHGGSKKNPKYLFAFDNQEMEMIISGKWGIGIFPIIPETVKYSDICGKFYIKYEGETLQCDVVSNNGSAYIYCHNDLDPLMPIDDDVDIIYTPDYSVKPNYRRKLLSAFSEAENVINTLIRAEKVFFNNNMSGYVFNTYLKWCKGLR